MTGISEGTRLSVSYVALVLVILFGAITFTAQAIDNSSYIAAVDVPAQLTRAGVRGDAIAGQEIKKEDRLETGSAGRANIALGSDMHIYLASNSGILVRQLHSSSSDDGGLKGIITVEKGMARVSSRVDSRPVHLRIEQETLKADIKKEASFMVNHNAGTDILCLFSGEINVRANNDSRVLKSPNTCFLYNGTTGASSVRNIQQKQVQAVLALTKVSSPSRQPLFASREASPSSGSISHIPVAAYEDTTKVLAPTSNKAVTTPSAPQTSAATSEPTPQATPAPTNSKAPIKSGSNAGVDVVAGAGLLEMMRRPAPGAELGSSHNSPKQTVVANRTDNTQMASSQTETSKAASKPAVAAPAATAVATQETKPAPVSRPIRTVDTVAKPAHNSRPAAVAPAKPAQKAPVKRQRAQVKKRYPTPSGKLEQWTINLAAYSQATNATALVVKLRKMGYKPIMRKITKTNGSVFYRLSISGLKTRIAAEAEAKNVLENTHISSYWLENIYLSR